MDVMQGFKGNLELFSKCERFHAEIHRTSEEFSKSERCDTEIQRKSEGCTDT